MRPGPHGCGVIEARVPNFVHRLSLAFDSLAQLVLRVRGRCADARQAVELGLPFPVFPGPCLV